MTGSSDTPLPRPGAAIRNLFLTSTALALVACGGSSSNDNSYTIGGAITGLTAGSVVLANGKASVTVLPGEGTWEFSHSFPEKSLYLVTVQTQPAGEMCLVTGGASGKLTADVSDVQVACSDGLWTYEGGTGAVNTNGVYGTQGSGATGNLPGARDGASSWTDSSGNLWLFGGYGYASVGSGELNDLWQYSPSTEEWTWVSGADTANATGTYGMETQGTDATFPGGRQAASSWIDTSGNLWLFGGYGYDATGNGDLDDLWQYSSSTGQWTWVSGSEVRNSSGVYGPRNSGSTGYLPGSREAASSWIDSSGNLWLFGGYGYDSSGALSNLNDLWEYSPGTREWTWVSGADTVNSTGVYGTQGVASADNVPGARQGASSWIDSSGNLWLFGGYGYDSTGAVGDLDDLWEYSLSTGEWTWVGGADTANAAGVYGTETQASASNMPGARQAASSWIDSSGNLWLFGGYGYDSTGAVGNLGDFWEYSPSTGEWNWVGGVETINDGGNYGTAGTAAATDLPGSRQAASSWVSSGNFWLFGGAGYGSTQNGYLDDLWQYSASQ